LKSGNLLAYLGRRKPVNVEDENVILQFLQFCPHGKHRMFSIPETMMMLSWSRNAMNTDQRSMQIPRKIVEDRNTLTVQHWMPMPELISFRRRKLRNITMKIGRDWSQNLFKSHCEQESTPSLVIAEKDIEAQRLAILRLAMNIGELVSAKIAK
jgi:hypothetical protein